MAMRTDTIDLEHLGLKQGGGWHGDVLVAAQPFVFGDQRYEPADALLPVRLAVSRTTSGYVVHARFEATLEGPCMRCFDDQPFSVAVDQNEVHEPQLELASEYATDSSFDLAGFVHDTIGLALPQTMSGELDGSGGCKLCGRTRAELRQIGIDDRPEDDEIDPRWAKLRELEL
jgi:uncharacterized protein